MMDKEKLKKFFNKVCKHTYNVNLKYDIHKDIARWELLHGKQKTDFTAATKPVIPRWLK
jgi:hypothetical protein